LALVLQSSSVKLRSRTKRGLPDPGVEAEAEGSRHPWQPGSCAGLGVIHSHDELEKA